jgi:ankyrin repeat protein
MAAGPASTLQNKQAEAQHLAKTQIENGWAAQQTKTRLAQLKKRLKGAKRQHTQLKKRLAGPKYASNTPVFVQEKDSQKIRSLEVEIEQSLEAIRSTAVVAANSSGMDRSANQITPGMGLRTKACAHDEKSGLYFAQAGKLESLRRLIEHEGWSIHAVDRHGTNSLMWAAGGGHLHIVKYLVQESVGGKLEIESRNNDGRTPLMWSLRNGQLEVTKWLVSAGADMNTTNKSGTNMLQWAVWGGHIPSIQWILDHSTLDPSTRNYYGCTAAHWCAARGDMELCRWFHRRGLPFNTVNTGGHSPLHKAAWHGHQEVCYWLVDEVRLGHTVYRRDWKGQSVVDMAAANGHSSLAAWLRMRCEHGIRRGIIQRKAALLLLL